MAQASVSARKETMAALVAAGAPVDFETANGRTALIAVCGSDKVDATLSTTAALCLSGVCKSAK